MEGTNTVISNAGEFDVEDVEFLRHDGKPLLMRLFRPRGQGPFPAIVDVHGGAWCVNDRTTEKGRHEALARGGIVVAVPDFRQAREGGYPLSVADINHSVRWVKAHARELKTRSDLVGISGQSSGGHLAMLVAMRPHDPRYSAIPVPTGSPPVDAEVRCVLLSWPVINPSGRYQHARRTQEEDAENPSRYPSGWPARLIERHNLYWPDLAAMEEGNPMLALERGEPVRTPPAIWVQTKNDILHDYRDPGSPFPGNEPERFAASYRRAGGQVELVYTDAPPKFTNEHAALPAAVSAFERLVAFVHQHIPVSG